MVMGLDLPPNCWVTWSGSFFWYQFQCQCSWLLVNPISIGCRQQIIQELPGTGFVIKYVDLNFLGTHINWKQVSHFRGISVIKLNWISEIYLYSSAALQKSEHCSVGNHLQLDNQGSDLHLSLFIALMEIQNVKFRRSESSCWGIQKRCSEYGPKPSVCTVILRATTY